MTFRSPINCLNPSLKPAMPTPRPVCQEFNDIFQCPQFNEEHNDATVTNHRFKRKMEHMERDYKEIQKECFLLSNQVNRNRLEKIKLNQENDRLKMELSILNNCILYLDETLYIFIIVQHCLSHGEIDLKTALIYTNSMSIALIT